MPHLRRKLTITEVSLCRKPANPGARVALFKDDEDESAYGTFAALLGLALHQTLECIYFSCERGIRFC